ncbi:MAG: flagellar basal body L-ring protein FlgH [Sphingomonadales bacterium]|nr:flagellar basal body L-ring protein FlgH [Sphingomonadales bacterium]
MTASAPLPLGIPAWRKPRSAPDRRSTRRMPLLAATVIAAAALSASPALARKAPSVSGFEATMPAPAPAHPADGSIFSASSYAPLYTGTRARAVGDALTIVLVESTTAAKTVGSKSQKSGGISLTPPKTGPFAFNPDAASASSNSNFNGQGNASQTSTLAASLSVTIAEVRPNGTALVRGEKRMLVSQGDEWIQVSGIVRLSDIDPDNTILSTRVADAHIEYTGKGALQRASKQGWLGRFFNLLSPF